MESCYYCDCTEKLLQCDAVPPCDKIVCKKHAVPEFEGQDVEGFTLCLEHAYMQVLAGETIIEHFARLDSESKNRKPL